MPQVAPEPAVHHEPELYPSRLSVDVEREDARVSLALRGELDLETAPQFREHLDDVEEDAMTLVVDLRNLTFLDSCGIGELVGATRRRGATAAGSSWSETKARRSTASCASPSSTRRSRPQLTRPGVGGGGACY
jgi:anti-anti-sigma factor